MDNTLKADIEKLAEAFKQYLPDNLSEIEIGANYGYMEGNEIRVFTKKAPRSFKIFAHDMLVAKIDVDGKIEYTFKRDTESAIFTIFVPLFILIFGCGLGAGLLKIYEMLLWIIPAAALFLCNLIKPKKTARGLA